jgi:hypothetical protein
VRDPAPGRREPALVAPLLHWDGAKIFAMTDAAAGNPALVDVPDSERPGSAWVQPFGIGTRILYSRDLCAWT